MSQPLQDLWPADLVAPDVMTPHAILQYQAEQLARRTNRLIEAEVRRETPKGEWTVLTFELVAPAVHGYRKPLFRVMHDPVMVYPARIDDFDEEDPEPYSVAGQPELMEALKRIFASNGVRSIIHSLIALSNEKGRPEGSVRPLQTGGV